MHRSGATGTRYVRILWLLSLVPVLYIGSSCNTLFPDPQVYDESMGVFICNEGNMTFGNASLSFYDPMLQEVKNQVFFNANNFPVGDVLQSMTIVGDLGYLVVNNSGKIFVMHTGTMRHVATITGLTSPRYMLPVDDKTAYVSDLYSREITVINTETQAIEDAIWIGASTEEMILSGTRVFALSWSYHHKMYQVDTEKRKVVDSVDVTMQPNSIEKDAQGMLWILSDGGYPGMTGSEAPAITCIDPDDLHIVTTLRFNDTLSSPTELTLNPSGDTLFFLNSGPGEYSDGVFRMSTKNPVLPSQPFIAAEDHLYYGLDCDPSSGILYVSDAVDHISKGIVYRFFSSGNPIDSFRVDIIPGSFCFKTR